MDQPSFLLTIGAFLLLIGPLVFIHEMGHYLAGRWFGVKADTFSIGFGREIAGWTDRRGTRWKVGWLPLGGYVKFAGDMNPASQPSDAWLKLPPEERAKTFQAKPLWQRAIIVAAGPFVNFLFAILAYIALFAWWGVPTNPAIVTAVQPGSAAAAAGFRPGDQVMSVNGQATPRFKDLYEYVRLRPGEAMRFDVSREGATVALNATPKADVMRDRFGNEARIGVLGVQSSAMTFERLPPHRIVGEAIGETAGMVKTTIVAIRQIIVGERSVRELGGPVKMAQLSGQQITLGWLAFFLFMVAISINLGFINLLPIPMLDGGHLAFYAIEAVRGKALGPKAQEWAFRAGLAILLGLMLFVTFHNDLASIGLWSALGGLIG